MAERGAPLGNQNAAKGRQWRDAINRALSAWPEKAASLECSRGITEAAYEFVAKLMAEKDIGFFRELGDRLDGKPAQAIVGDADADPVQVQAVVRFVEPEKT